MSTNGARIPPLTVAVELLVGISAFFGGYGLLKDAEGLGMPGSWLERSPFSDYKVPGLFLSVIIGGGMIVAALLALRRSPAARAAAQLMGLILLSWLVIETLIIGFRTWQQYVLLAITSACGLILLLRPGYAAERDQQPPSGDKPHPPVTLRQ